MPETFLAADDVLARTVGDEVVLLQLSTEKYFGLAGTAAAMWSAIIEHGSIDAAFAVLIEQFDVSDEELRADLERFVAQLVERRLLQA